jgi:hypothetical protein
MMIKLVVSKDPFVSAESEMLIADYFRGNFREGFADFDEPLAPLIGRGKLLCSQSHELQFFGSLSFLISALRVMMSSRSRRALAAS